MTNEIRRDIEEHGGKKYGLEIHGQGGSEPGTVEGAPSKEEFRSLPSELLAILEAEEDDTAKQGDMDIDLATGQAVAAVFDSRMRNSRQGEANSFLTLYHVKKLVQLLLSATVQCSSMG